MAQTPDRYPSRRRLVELQSTVRKKPPSAAALAQRAYLDELPDRRTAAAAAEGVAAVSRAKPSIPAKFTGDDNQQNEQVERWVEAVNTWLRLSDVHPSHYLDYARGYFHTSGSASAWLQQRDEEVAHFDKEMTWEWLQHQLIQHFGQPTGVSASEAAWIALRMGEKNADGSETGGAATRTVKDYTARFCHYMRILTSHDVRTTEFLVITHYVEGIRLGYEALHRAMKGTQLVLRFDTLQEAIEAAQLAEVNIAINRN